MLRKYSNFFFFFNVVTMCTSFCVRDENIIISLTLVCAITVLIPRQAHSAYSIMSKTCAEHVKWSATAYKRKHKSTHGVPASKELRTVHRPELFRRELVKLTEIKI